METGRPAEGLNLLSRPQTLLILLLATLLLAVWLAPARPVLSWIGNAVPQVTIDRIYGGLWRGKAELLAVQMGSGWLSLGSVQWQLSPLSLVLLQPQLTVQTRHQNSSLDAQMRFKLDRSIEVSNALVEFDSELLNRSIRRAGLRIYGRIVATVNNFSWHREAMHISANGAWEAAEIVVNGRKIKLGNYFGDLKHDESGHPVLTISSAEDALLQVTGTLSYNKKTVSSNLMIMPAETIPLELSHLLQRVAGEADQEGNYSIQTEISITL